MRLSIFTLVLFTFLLEPAKVISQNNRTYISLENGMWTKGKEFVRGSETLKLQERDNIQGMPYFNEEWLTGEVLLIEDIRSKPIKLKIDTYANQVHFLREGKTLALDKGVAKAVYLEKDGETIVFKNGFDVRANDIDSETLLRVIYDGNVKLLAHHETSIRKAPASSIISGTSEPEFSHKTEYYLQKPNGKVEKVRRLKGKHILRALENFKNRVEEYADENDLDFGDEKDLAKILAYYDEISGEEN